MIDRIAVFEDYKDLLLLTGLKSRDELWEAGFDLNDMDFGICTNTAWEHEEEDEEWENGKCVIHKRMEPDWDPFYRAWILNRMSEYCVGYQHIEYRGMHYYILYHS